MKIKLYALSTCPWCKKTKQFLNEKGIAFEFVDVDLVKGEEQKNALKEVDSLTGKRSFPILVVDETVIQGYNEDKMLEALGYGK